MSSRLILRNCSPSASPRARRATQPSKQYPRQCAFHHGSGSSRSGDLWRRFFSGSGFKNSTTIHPVFVSKTSIALVASQTYKSNRLLTTSTLAGLDRPVYSIQHPPTSSYASYSISRTPALSSAVRPPQKPRTSIRQSSTSTQSPLDPNAQSSQWQFPNPSGNRTNWVPASERNFQGPLPLPIALKTFKPAPFIPKAPHTTSEPPRAIPQLTFPPPPVVLGSRPLYYLAKRFPILAEQELQRMSKRTALDYSSFIIGAMSTSYPSATTIRAVLRQFRMFLRESTQKSAGSNKSELRFQQDPSMELPRTRIWTQAIRGMIWLKQYRRARVAIHTMQRLGLKPTGYAWRGICRGWIEQGELDQAEALALKVFTRPEISHDYQLDERPYYFTDMQAERRGDSAGRPLNRSPMSPNSAPLFLVVEALAECGEMERARHLFDMIPEQEMTDLLTSDMVAGYLRAGQQNKAQEVIRVMARCGVKPTAIVFNPIVEHATKHVGMAAAEDLVEDMVKLGLFLNLYTYKILVHGYLLAGRGDKAIGCIDRLHASGIEPDRALGRILLRGLWHQGESRRGDYGPSKICEINRMESQDDVRLLDEDVAVGPGWSQRCLEWVHAGQLELAEEALHLALNRPDSKLDSEIVSVIKAFTERNEMRRARHWFDEFATRISDGPISQSGVEVELMNHMVEGYIQAHQPKAAEHIIGVMSQRGIQPTVQTINMILRWSTLQANMEAAEALVQRMGDTGIEPDTQTFEILCEGYAARGSTESFRACLARMKEAKVSEPVQGSFLAELCQDLLGLPPVRKDSEQFLKPSASLASTDPVHSNALATLCTRWVEQGQLSKAEDFVNQLRENTFVPKSKIPYKALIQGWIQQSQRNDLSPSLLKNASSSADSSPDTTNASSVPPASVSVKNSKSLDREQQLLKGSIDNMRRARSWFNLVPESERTLDMFNDMVGGYMALGLEHESDGIVQWMAASKIKPDVHTYNHILEHMTKKLDMPAAESLVQKMQRGGIEPNTTTWNSLIRGYVIRGQLSQALVCLGRMTGKDLSIHLPVSKAKSSRKKEVIATYDKEILEAVVEEDTTQAQDDQNYQPRASRGSSRSDSESKPVMSQLEPDHITEQLILAGFGAEVEPVQGQGDYSRALELYRDRVERQDHQERQLLQRLDSLMGKRDGEDLGEEDWILNHLDVVQELGESVTELGMTDLDWKNALKWEEMMEVEKARERELSGRS
ncbi:hypothetical protein EMPS_00619 [Entomortierella parvispora]|uniref:Pentacotripeptide-repeat region of PRORP domain-containing protein n=1 Tax=Entomortierella parvispora TaxID=205924 RepID=A0A9P3LRU1_9FUNG|nr:hypothetical protein EMPS_00619 [Entomortierella parvispora]